jgi:hypothetical protein
MGYFWSVVTHALPIMAIFAVIFPSPAALALTLFAFTQRYLLRRLVRQRLGTPVQPRWLLLARELASLLIWAASYAGRSIQWRNATFLVARGGGLSAGNGPVSGPPLLSDTSSERAAWIIERSS